MKCSSVRIVNLTAEILTGHLPNRSQKYYGLNQLPWFIPSCSTSPEWRFSKRSLLANFQYKTADEFIVLYVYVLISSLGEVEIKLSEINGDKDFLNMF